MSKSDKHADIEKAKHKSLPEETKHKKKKTKSTPKKSDHKHEWEWSIQEDDNWIHVRVWKKTCTICGKVVPHAKWEWN